MKIAITHPTTLARVARGTERLIHETATYMAARGHDVRIIACKPGPREVTQDDGYALDVHRRLWHPLLGRVGIREEHAFVLTCLRELLRTRYDVVHAHSIADAFAASLARRVTGTPYVYFVNGLPPAVPYYRTVSTGGAVFRRSILAADEIICVSDYVRSYIEKRFGRRGCLIPVPVHGEVFASRAGPRHVPPIVFCAAALEDRRKGGRTLMRAFNLVKKVRPEVILENASAISASTRAELLELVAPQWRDDVRFLGAVAPDEVPALFGRAQVSVLPSMWEAFGLVTIESMAAGTPVVGTHDGALPEIICDPAVGLTFDPGADASVEPNDPQALAEAILAGLDLGADPRTAERCRGHAAQYDWARLGPRIESLYEQVVERRRGARLSARGR